MDSKSSLSPKEIKEQEELDAQIKRALERDKKLHPERYTREEHFTTHVGDWKKLMKKSST